MPVRLLAPALLAALLLPACTDDGGEGGGGDTDEPAGPGENTAPLAIIDSPLADTRYYNDVPIPFLATVADMEQPASQLDVAWVSDISGAIDVDTQPDAGGVLEGEALLVEGTHEITLVVTDGDGLVGSASTTIVVGGVNSAPTCAFSSPVDGDVVGQTSQQSFAGVVGDADQTMDTLLVTFTSDVDGELGSVVPDENGNVAVETDYLTAGTHTVTLSVSDEVGLTCTDTVTIGVSEPPTVEILSPENGEHVDEGEAVAFTGTVSDDLDAAGDLTVVWSSDIDGDLWTSPADADGSTSFETDVLSGVGHFIWLTATDAQGQTASAWIWLNVNAPPSAPVVAIAPDAPTTDDDLVATLVAESVDPEGDQVTYLFSWTVDGVAYPDATRDTVPASATEPGQVWTVTVVPNDGRVDGEAATASVTIE